MRYNGVVRGQRCISFHVVFMNLLEARRDALVSVAMSFDDERMLHSEVLQRDMLLTLTDRLMAVKR